MAKALYLLGAFAICFAAVQEPSNVSNVSNVTGGQTSAPTPAPQATPTATPAPTDECSTGYSVDHTGYWANQRNLTGDTSAAVCAERCNNDGSCVAFSRYVSPHGQDNYCWLYSDPVGVPTMNRLALACLKATPESGSVSFDVKITASADVATLAADAAFVGMMADAGAKILFGASANRSNATINVTLADATSRRLSVQEGSSYAVTASYTATLSSAQMQQLATSRAADGAAAKSLFNAAFADSSTYTYTITPDEASFTAALASVNTQSAEFLSNAGLEAATPAPTLPTPGPPQALCCGAGEVDAIDSRATRSTAVAALAFGVVAVAALP